MLQLLLQGLVKLLTPTMSRPVEVKIVGFLLCYTCSRTMMARQLNSAKMFGGENADGWLGPWLSDTILGILTPFAIYGAFTGKGVVAWGLLLSFLVLPTRLRSPCETCESCTWYMALCERVLRWGMLVS